MDTDNEMVNIGMGGNWVEGGNREKMGETYVLVSIIKINFKNFIK